VNALLQQIRRTIQRHGLCPPGSPVLVGVSGGSDSIALTRALLDLAHSGDFKVVGLAHFNHRLRPSAARDERFCRDVAVRLGVAIVVEEADVAAHAPDLVVLSPGPGDPSRMYPQIATDFERTFKVLKSLPADIFLGAHGGYFGMEAKYERMKAGAAMPFVDPEGYKKYVDEREKAFRNALARQQKTGDRQ